jgi:acyl carrier protein
MVEGANPPDRRPPTLEEATGFLVERIADLRHRTPADIDPTMAFNALGIDSLEAITLMGDIETRFSLTIDPSEIFDHPTPCALAQAIIERSSRHG